MRQAAGLAMDLDELLEAGLASEDHVVGQEDGAGLALDEQASRPHRVAQSERFFLLDVCDDKLVAQLVDLAEDVEQVALTPLLEVVLELQRPVEVIDDGALAAAGDHDHLLDAAGDRLFDAVLDGRLVDEGQHLFRLRLCRRQEPGAETSGGKDRLADQGARHPRQSISWTRSKGFGPAWKDASNAWWTATCSPTMLAARGHLPPRR